MPGTLSAGEKASRGWPLWIQVLIAMVLGIGTGLLLSPDGAGVLSVAFVEPVAAWIALPGRIFLALIQMIVIALVMSSIMLGVAEGGGETLRRIGPRILAYFLCTTVVAVVIGVVLASVIRPGDHVDASALPPVIEEPAPLDVVGEETVPDRIVRLIPTNLVQAQLQRDMLLIVIAAIFMGLALVSIAPELATPVLDVARGVQAAAMRIVDWAMRLAPVAVFGLLCDITIRAGRPRSSARPSTSGPSCWGSSCCSCSTSGSRRSSAASARAGSWRPRATCSSWRSRRRARLPLCRYP